MVSAKKCVGKMLKSLLKLWEACAVEAGGEVQLLRGELSNFDNAILAEIEGDSLKIATKNCLTPSQIKVALERAAEVVGAEETSDSILLLQQNLKQNYYANSTYERLLLHPNNRAAFFNHSPESYKGHWNSNVNVQWDVGFRTLHRFCEFSGNSLHIKTQIRKSFLHLRDTNCSP